MRLIVLTLLVLVVLAVQPALAQHGTMSPYAGQQHRAIKALSPREHTGLLQGEGMGLAKAAELNHYPGPTHVLALAAELNLDAAQTRQVRRTFERMQTEAVRLGKRILALEQDLDALFARGRADERAVADLTAEIGRLRGALRATHLQAHVALRRVLTDAQVARYDRLRGYVGPAADGRPADSAPAGHGHMHGGHAPATSEGETR